MATNIVTDRNRKGEVVEHALPGEGREGERKRGVEIEIEIER